MEQPKRDPERESHIDSVRELGQELGRGGTEVVRVVQIFGAASGGVTVEAIRIFMTRPEGTMMSIVLETGIASVAFFVALRYGRKIWNGIIPSPDEE